MKSMLSGANGSLSGATLLVANMPVAQLSSARPLSLAQLPGWLALSLIVGISLLAFLALAGWGRAEPYGYLIQEGWFWALLRFSLWQALLSAALSVLLALPLARSLALDPKLPGKQWFLSWCLLCFVMPSLILITGMVALFGRSGWLTPWLGESWQLYGLNGILLAHVFLNLPFAIRVLTFQWQSIPANTWKLSAQLGMTGWQRFKVIEWPVIRGVLPAVSGFIFLLCFNSFAVVLALGGGPAASTLEVAIYQALKYDFNPSEALFLAWTQLLVAGGIYLIFSRMGRFQWLAPVQSGQVWLPTLSSVFRWFGRLGYLLCLLFLTLPILVLLPLAWQADWAFLQQTQLTAVIMRSLVLAVSAAVLAVCLALALLSLWRASPRERFRQWIAGVALYPLVVPAMVVSVGIYILLMPWVDWYTHGWIAVILMNAVIALPFAFQQLRPALSDYDASYARLLADLNLTHFTHWRYVYLPYLKPLLRRVLAISFVLALGDMSVFAIFGSDDWRTLPWLIYSLAGGYRLAEAAWVSILLLFLALAALRLLEKSYE